MVGYNGSTHKLSLLFDNSGLEGELTDDIVTNK